MNSSYTIRAFLSHEWKIYKDLRLKSLADSPDAFGSTLAKEQNRADVEWSSRLASGVNSDWNLPLIAEIDELPIGLAWGRIDKSNPDVANLYQMWVAPIHRCLGVGQALLDETIAWAISLNIRYLELGVTFRDSPAFRLYQRNGFLPVGAPQKFRQGSDLLGQKMRLGFKENAT